MNTSLEPIHQTITHKSILIVGGKATSRAEKLETILNQAKSDWRVLHTKSHPKDSESILKSFHRDIIQVFNPQLLKSGDASFNRIRDVYPEALSSAKGSILLILNEWGHLAKIHPKMFTDFISEFLTLFYQSKSRTDLKLRVVLTTEQLPTSFMSDLRFHVGLEKSLDPANFFSESFSVIKVE